MHLRVRYFYRPILAARLKLIAASCLRLKDQQLDIVARFIGSLNEIIYIARRVANDRELHSPRRRGGLPAFRSNLSSK